MKCHPRKDSCSAKKEGGKATAEAEGSQRAAFYKQPSRKYLSTYKTVVVSLEGSSKRVSFEQRADVAGKAKKEKSSMVIRLPGKSERMASKGTQTDYRESEVQTLAWKHEVKAEGSTLQQFLSLDWLSSEKNFPLGMDEVKLIEATRQQLAWENIIKKLRGAENASKRRSLVLRTTGIVADVRERRREEEIGERIEISRRDLGEARRAFEEKLRFRLLRSYGSRRLENDSKIDYCHRQVTRKIRKMNSVRSRSATKRDIVSIHKDKASDLYAPKLRDGLNPSLGHENIQIQCRYLKRFHGLEILERRLTEMPQRKFPKCRPDIPGLNPRGAEPCPRKFRERGGTTVDCSPVTNFPALPKGSETDLDGLSVRVPIPALTPGYRTPAVTNPLSDSEENLQQACLLLKKVIRGRSLQTAKFSEVLRLRGMLT